MQKKLQKAKHCYKGYFHSYPGKLSIIFYLSHTQPAQTSRKELTWAEWVSQAHRHQTMGIITRYLNLTIKVDEMCPSPGPGCWKDHDKRQLFRLKCRHWFPSRDTEINRVWKELINSKRLTFDTVISEQQFRSLTGTLALVLSPSTNNYRNTSPLLPSLAVLPSTWKVPFDSSSFLSFPCSCKRFCRCCRELDSPATNPLKWLFPSLQPTVPSFPLALWKAKEWFGKVTLVLGCRTNSKREGKETKHLQGLHKPPHNSSRSCAAFRPSIHSQGRKGHFIFSGGSKSLEQCCAAS